VTDDVEQWLGSFRPRPPRAELRTKTLARCARAVRAPWGWPWLDVAAVAALVLAVAANHVAQARAPSRAEPRPRTTEAEVLARVLDLEPSGALAHRVAVALSRGEHELTPREANRFLDHTEVNGG
jgi:hypothetical protein